MVYSLQQGLEFGVRICYKAESLRFSVSGGRSLIRVHAAAVTKQVTVYLPHSAREGYTVYTHNLFKTRLQPSKSNKHPSGTRKSQAPQNPEPSGQSRRSCSSFPQTCSAPPLAAQTG